MEERIGRQICGNCKTGGTKVGRVDRGLVLRDASPNSQSRLAGGCGMGVGPTVRPRWDGQPAGSLPMVLRSDHGRDARATLHVGI